MGIMLMYQLVAQSCWL